MWNARLWQFAHTVLMGLALLSIGCQKDSEAIVSIALHPTNSNILYVTVAKPGRNFPASAPDG
jgi:hypothetical protein